MSSSIPNNLNKTLIQNLVDGTYQEKLTWRHRDTHGPINGHPEESTTQYVCETGRFETRIISTTQHGERVVIVDAFKDGVHMLNSDSQEYPDLLLELRNAVNNSIWDRMLRQQRILDILDAKQTMTRLDREPIREICGAIANQTTDGTLQWETRTDTDTNTGETKTHTAQMDGALFKLKEYGLWNRYRLVMSINRQPAGVLESHRWQDRWVLKVHNTIQNVLAQQQQPTQPKPTEMEVPQDNESEDPTDAAILAEQREFLYVLKERIKEKL